MDAYSWGSFHEASLAPGGASSSALSGWRASGQGLCVDCGVGCRSLLFRRCCAHSLLHRCAPMRDLELLWISILRTLLYSCTIGVSCHILNTDFEYCCLTALSNGGVTVPSSKHGKRGTMLHHKFKHTIRSKPVILLRGSTSRMPWLGVGLWRIRIAVLTGSHERWLLISGKCCVGIAIYLSFQSLHRKSKFRHLLLHCLQCCACIRSLCCALQLVLVQFLCQSGYFLT
jgi:hypothetical protein